MRSHIEGQHESHPALYPSLYAYPLVLHRGSYCRVPIFNTIPEYQTR